MSAGTESNYKFAEDNKLALPETADPTLTALAMIKGTADRDREVYYPYLQVRPVVLFRDWVPGILEFLAEYNTRTMKS